MTRPGPSTGVPQCTGWGAGLAALVAVCYYGFLLTGAFAPQSLARPAIGHVPWSFLLGAGLLLLAVLTTGLYVLVSNAAEARARRSA